MTDDVKCVHCGLWKEMSEIWGDYQENYFCKICAKVLSKYEFNKYWRFRELKKEAKEAGDHSG